MSNFDVHLQVKTGTFDIYLQVKLQVDLKHIYKPRY